MDNAMVKRGIGAVVLAIIAALLLGYLLKDKSRDRQEIVDMKIPGTTELAIPSLSDTSSNITDSAASLVDEATEKVSDAGNAVVASASGTLSNITDDATSAVGAVSDTASSVTNSVVDAVSDATAVKTSSANPGFSFRPPAKNEEQKIDTSTSINSLEQASTSETNNTVVASSKKAEVKEAKKFKPTIEKEPKKDVKKVVKKQAKKKVIAKKAPAKASTKQAPAKAKPATTTASTKSKYAIQLLATSSQSRANKLANTMKGEGYEAFVTKTTSNNKILYRVRVGGHKDRSSALSAQEAMKRRYQKNYSVQNSLVISQ